MAKKDNIVVDIPKGDVTIIATDKATAMKAGSEYIVNDVIAGKLIKKGVATLK